MNDAKIPILETTPTNNILDDWAAVGVMHAKHRNKWQVMCAIRAQLFFGKEKNPSMVTFRRPVPYVATIPYHGDKVRIIPQSFFSMKNYDGTGIAPVEWVTRKELQDRYKSGGGGGFSGNGVIGGGGGKSYYDDDSLITSRIRDLLHRLESGEIKAGDSAKQSDLDLMRELKCDVGGIDKSIGFLKQKLQEK